MEHTFCSIIHNLGGMLNNWSELGGLSAQRSFACSWWICGILCTLQGERGNIVLSCVSVFTAHSLINYSAGPSDCDLQFRDEARVFSALVGSVTALAPLIFATFHVLTIFLCIFQKTHRPRSEKLLCSSSTEARASKMTAIVFHLLKWVKVMSSMATSGNPLLSLFSCSLWTEVKKRRGSF